MHSILASSGLSLDPIAKPIAAILAAIYSVVPNYGVAILVLSVAWMLLIAPLTLKTTRSMLAMQKLQPQLKKLQEQHRNDRAALSQATMDLYKQNNVSPFGSCLPTLLPLPIFFALFRVISGLSHIVNGIPAPKYLSQSTEMYKHIKAAGGHLNAFGVDLSKNALSSHSGVFSALPYFVLILVMMGTQYLQTVQMMSRNPANADNPQAKMMKFLPLVFGVFCIRFPAGVVLYYAMSNVCRIAQQSLMYRYDPKVKALAAKDIQEVEAETRDIETGRRQREPQPPPAARSRFRDLLASAAEQSAKAKEERAAGADGKGAGGARKGVPTNGKNTGSTRSTSPGKSKGGSGAPANGGRGVSASKPAAGGAKPAAAGSKAAISGGRAGNGSKPPVSGPKPAANGAKPPAAAGTVSGRAGNGNGGGATNTTRRSRNDAASAKTSDRNGTGDGTQSRNGGGEADPSSGPIGAADRDDSGSDNRPTTGASAGSGGRTGAARANRTNRKRRGQ